MGEGAVREVASKPSLSFRSAVNMADNSDDGAATPGRACWGGGADGGACRAAGVGTLVDEGTDRTGGFRAGSEEEERPWSKDNEAKAVSRSLEWCVQNCM